MVLEKLRLFNYLGIYHQGPDRADRVFFGYFRRKNEETAAWDSVI